ncbi:MAG: energy-coupling factor transporter transmembrane protein EcfT [Natronospirillum sp.]
MISLYLAQRSWLHRTPAGIKLLALAVVSISLFPVSHLGLMGSALGITLALYASIGREAVKQLRLLKPLLPLFLLIFLLQWWSIGWADGLLLVLRMATLVLLANLVTLTTRMDDMMAALRPLFWPLQVFGVNPARIAFAVALLIRFVPVLMAVVLNLLDAWRARGGGKQVWKLAVPLTIQAIRMSDHVAEAIAARGGISPPLPTHSPSSTALITSTGDAHER